MKMTMILDKIHAEEVKALAEKGERLDGRQLLQYRPITVDRNPLENPEGSAMAHFGNTKVLVGVKVDLVAPFADRPNDGVISVNAEFTPLAHPDFEPGPPKEGSIELARVVDRAIRSAEVLPLSKLGENPTDEGKVLGVYIDVYPLDHNGNLTDAACLAAMAALKSCKVPKIEDGKLVRGESAGGLPLQREAAAVSFEVVNGKVFVDATDVEELASFGRVTFGVTNDGFLCAGQKSGAAGISREKLMELADLALENGKSLFKLIK